MSRMQEDMQMCKHSLEESMREKEKLREQVVQLTRQQSQHANNSTPERSFASKAGSLPTRGHSITPERRPVKEFPADMSLQDSFTSSVADGGLDWTRWSRNTSIYDQWSRASHDQPSTTASAAFPPRANTNASSVASVAPSAKHQQILTSKDFRESLNSIYSATSSTKPISKSLDQIVFEGKKEPTSATKKDQQELMEIYQDIGRLTRKLEDRLSESDHQQYMKHPGKGSPSTSSPPQLSSATTMMMSSRRSSSSANNNTSRGQPLPSQPTTSAFASRNNRSTNSSFSSYQKNM